MSDHDLDASVDPVGEPVKVLFVCLGNICRSPTAEAVMAHRVVEAGLAHRFHIDSAGTSALHIGDPPDARSVAEAQRRGIAMTSRARQVNLGDLIHFDHVLAMDRRNLADLHDLALDEDQRTKVALLRAFDPAGPGDATDGLEVPDPYYGRPRGFADVFDLIDAACLGLLDHIRSTGTGGTGAARPG